MKQELADALVREFPFIRCDLAIGDGWEPLLRTALKGIAALAVPDTFAIDCIKEKFGELRVYIWGVDTADPLYYEIGVLIVEATATSVTVCETCGAPGRRRRGSWIKTLCDAHAAERS